jgi:hypothetical protein
MASPITTLITGASTVLSYVIGFFPILALGTTLGSISYNLYQLLGGTVSDSLIHQHLCNTSNLSNLLDPLALYLGIGLMIAAVLYLIGVITGRKDYINYIKLEIPEIIFIIILIPFILINCIDWFNIGTSNFNVGKILWLHFIYNQLAGAYIIQLVSGILAVPLTATASFGAGQSAGFSGIWMFLKAGFSNALTISLIGVVMARLMLILYEIFTYGFFVYLLPLGFILRAFPPSKRFGGTLIGVSIGSLIILPLASAVFFNMIANYGLFVYNPTTQNFDINPKPSFLKTFVNDPYSIFPGLNPSSSSSTTAPSPSTSTSPVTSTPTSTAGTTTTSSTSSPPDPVKQANDDHDMVNAATLFLKLGGGTAALVLGNILRGRATGTAAKITGFIASVAGITALFITAFQFLSDLLLIPSILGFLIIVIVPILLNAIRIFTGLFGEPIDLSNLTRLI